MYEVLLKKALHKVSADLQMLEQRLGRLDAIGKTNTAEVRDLLGLIAKRKDMAQRLREEIAQTSRRVPPLRIHCVAT
jgi:hypothetical protein